MNQDPHPHPIELDPDDSLWERFFSVFPLVVVGTREADGAHDLAPKHLAMPLSWSNHFGFVCTPRHNTYANVVRQREFAVSYVRPSQTLLASLAATPRCDDGSKPITAALPTLSASRIDAPLVEDSYLHLECELERIDDDLGENSLIIGRIVAARAAPEVLRAVDRDDGELISGSPLLAYLYPGRFAEISHSDKLPFPAGFKR